MKKYVKGVNRVVFGASLIAGLFGLSSASTVNVDLNEEHQVIRGFGGMVHNQWQGGAGLSDADAELAFGTGDGHIGLNTLRIPVYANSSDFNKEVNAAKSAKKYAGDDFILYATPWTSNYAGANTHIKSSDYQNYVNHLNEFSAYMKNQGVPLYAISISNEPDWCGEWACWSADEIYNFTKNYGDQLRKNGTKVISTESFAYQKKLYDKVLNDENALKNWDILGAHFYAMTAKTGDDFFKYSLADQKKVERWMTEHYTESQGSGNDWRVMRKTGDQATANQLDTVRAMDVGYEIHRGLALGNFSQYTWWYIKRTYGLIMTNTSSGITVTQAEMNKISKRGYVLSHFARFIRPGAIRVGATINPEKEVYASAYKSADGDSTIVVLVNRDYKNAKTVTVNVPGANIETFHMYTTSESKNAKDEGEIEATNGSVTINMESGSSNKDCIVTLVGVGPQIVVPQEPYKGNAWSIPGKIEAEDFDVPGSGKGNNSFYDSDSENHGDSDYRAKDAPSVDIYKKTFGLTIGYTQAGEWLEYTVDVKKDGDYTMFASVASSNGTASFQISMDEKVVTDTIVVPKTVTTEGDFNEYSKVQTNLSLTAGKHIMRFTVTSDWMDVDYFTFVEGKNATDPELGEIKMPENKTDGIFDVHLSTGDAESFEVFSLNGQLLGKVFTRTQDLNKATSKLVKNSGVYLVKSASGLMKKVTIK